MKARQNIRSFTGQTIDFDIIWESGTEENCGFELRATTRKTGAMAVITNVPEIANVIVPGIKKSDKRLKETNWKQSEEETGNLADKLIASLTIASALTFVEDAVTANSKTLEWTEEDFLNEGVDVEDDDDEDVESTSVKAGKSTYDDILDDDFADELEEEF